MLLKEVILSVIVFFYGEYYAQHHCTVEEDLKAKAAMAYHGIVISYQDPAEYNYFYRYGKKCPLYTAGFEKWYKRR